MASLENSDVAGARRDDGQDELPMPKKKQKLDTQDSSDAIIKVESMDDLSSTELLMKNMNDVLAPVAPKDSVSILINPETQKYILPTITREESHNARIFLKYYGLQKFLDAFLPEQLNTIYIYHLIRLLGFEINDSALVASINAVTERDTGIVPQQKRLAITEDDPLEKKQAVRLIKDLQRAINKILCTRVRLSHFHTPEHFVSKLVSAQKILVLTGAGVSTSLGIPDFRSSEGFYSKIKYLGLDDPQDVFNYDIFMQDPSVFYNIAYMILPPENMYSPLHSFIKMLQDKGKLLRNYTQNIDNLESYAGINPENMVQCHGSFATASCVTCHWQIKGERIFKNIRDMELPLCPYCYKKRKEFFPATVMPAPIATSFKDNRANTNSSAGNASTASLSPVPGMYAAVPKSYGVLKPDITFFGEALPSKFHKTIREDILKCDLLICIGTSLKVAPVSEIVNMVPAHVPQILINKDPVKHAEFDLSLLGLCDDVVAYITEKCDWDIPHAKWEQLKNIHFQCIEKDTGIYSITPDTPK